MRSLLFVFGLLGGAALVGAGLLLWSSDPTSAVSIAVWTCIGVVYLLVLCIFFRAYWPTRPRFRYQPDAKPGVEKYVNVIWSGGVGKSEARSAEGLVDRVKSLLAEGRKIVVLVHSHAPSYRLVIMRSHSPEGICLCYFTGRKSGHPGFKSVGEPDGEPSKTSLGRVSADNGQSMQLGGDSSLEDDVAYQGIEEFFEEPNLPESIPWKVA